MVLVVDVVLIKVCVLCDFSQCVVFFFVIENFEFNFVDSVVKIIVNLCMGIIVVGQNVCFKLVVVIYGGMMVVIKENLNVSQFNVLGGGQMVVVLNIEIEVIEKQGKMFKLELGVILDDLVCVVNEVGVVFFDLMVIL